MPKLKPGSGPIDRNECRDGHLQGREEHEAWVLEVYAKHYPGEDPRPCDCGYFSDDWLVTCEPSSRERFCKRDVEKRLAAHHRRNHERELAKKRQFPAPPSAPGRLCNWCHQPIVHGRHDRTMHDGRLDEPRCRWLHGLHTHLPTQQAYLIERDGLGCAGCGAIRGGWGRVWLCQEHRAAERGVEGETQFISWVTSLEVDHRICLALAWEAFPEDERRRWFFSPANLSLLCGDCHKAKTVEDRRLIAQAYDLGPEWAKAEVLRRLQEARLIAGARPKGAL